MSTNNDTIPKHHWYHEPIAWLLVAVIALAVCWVGFSLTVAIVHQDSLVIDDYYKNGKAINHDFTQDKNASNAHITAEISIQSDSLKITAKVNSNNDHWPMRLYLSFSSSAFPEQDQTATLIKQLTSSKDDQNHIAFYIGHFEYYPNGVYYINLSTNKHTGMKLDDNEIQNSSPWRIKQKITINKNEPIRLSYD